MNRTFAPLQAFVEELAAAGAARGDLPGLAQRPDRPDPRRPEGSRRLRDRRALGRLLRARHGQGHGRPVAVTCTSAPRRPTSIPRWRRRASPPPAPRAHRRPPTRAARRGRRAGDRPVKLYGSAAKWFVEVGTHEPAPRPAVHHRALACRADWTAASGRPGPVHLNFPLREPLAPVPRGPGPDRLDGRPDGAPGPRYASRRRAAPGDVHERGRADRGRPHGVIVCGPAVTGRRGGRRRPRRGPGWPLLADPPSGAMRPPRPRARGRALRPAPPRRALRERRAELVLRVGDTPVSKPLRAWSPAPQWCIDPNGTWHEPARARRARLHAAAAPPSSAGVAARRSGRCGDWLGLAGAADAAVVGPAVAGGARAFEGALAAWTRAARRAGVGQLLDAHPRRGGLLPAVGERLRFLANRGANGIDGVVSSAIGAALATRPARLRADRRDGAAPRRRRSARRPPSRRDLTIVCVNNDGGGIFDFLPVAEHADPAAYEAHIATPSEGVDLAALWPGLREIRTDRRRNVALHRELVERVAQSV